MKRTVFLSLSILLAAFCVAAQNYDQKPPTLEVNGSAEIFVQPDQVPISLDVTRTDKDLQVAKEQVDSTVSKVLALTSSFEIKPENVKTHYISVEMKYNSIRDPQKRIFDEEGDEIGTRVFIGYEVSTGVSVRITDIGKFQGFLDEVLKTGISEVSSVRFESSELRKYRDMARDMAMKAAQEKASAMARSIGQEIGKAIFIKEGRVADQTNSRYSSNVYANSNIAIVDGVNVSRVEKEGLATFSPGAISINAEVSVIFLLN
ncbi:MAG: SIMPL domain-containing protein [Acidobacteria bacterium]|nr:SIMPL domain-containing protein [Acidobacteriota bacterium]